MGRTTGRRGDGCFGEEEEQGRAESPGRMGARPHVSRAGQLPSSSLGSPFPPPPQVPGPPAGTRLPATQGPVPLTREGGALPSGQGALSQHRPSPDSRFDYSGS